MDRYNPADRGGPTNSGITTGTLRRWRGDPELTAAHVKALTRDEARPIYRRDYLEGRSIYRLPSCLRPQVFDMSINRGPARAVRLLQEVLDALGPRHVHIARVLVRDPADRLLVRSVETPDARTCVAVVRMLAARADAAPEIKVVGGGCVDGWRI